MRTNGTKTVGPLDRTRRGQSGHTKALWRLRDAPGVKQIKWNQRLHSRHSTISGSLSFQTFLQIQMRSFGFGVLVATGLGTLSSPTILRNSVCRGYYIAILCHMKISKTFILPEHHFGLPQKWFEARTYPARGSPWVHAQITFPRGSLHHGDPSLPMFLTLCRSSP